jgi:hypothetical protein
MRSFNAVMALAPLPPESIFPEMPIADKARDATDDRRGPTFPPPMGRHIAASGRPGTKVLLVNRRNRYIPWNMSREFALNTAAPPEPRGLIQTDDQRFAVSTTFARDGQAVARVTGRRDSGSRRPSRQ